VGAAALSCPRLPASKRGGSEPRRPLRGGKGPVLGGGEAREGHGAEAEGAYGGLGGSQGPALVV